MKVRLPGYSTTERWISPRCRRFDHRRNANAVSKPGRSIERDEMKFIEAVEGWKSVPKLPRRKSSLHDRLDEIRRRIVSSGEPLLSSWEEVDRELGERRSGDEV